MLLVRKTIVMKQILITVLLFVMVRGVYAQKVEEPTTVKNIILLIGDGMGVSQVSSGMIVNGGQLNMDRAQAVGLSKTSSASHLITDSGAGGTAIATGKKTYNSAIGVDNDTVPIKTILEYAEENKLATGLISTSSITHATPASFIAHEKFRKSMEAIAADFLEIDIDIFIGGGKKNFEARKDNLNLSDTLKSRGYQVCYSLDEISDESEKIACLSADKHLKPVNKGRGNFFPEAVKLTLDRLSKSEKGFFLMAEGSQIDWGGHANNADYVTSEVIDFDKAVGLAFDFADKNPGTLVIVTADHETGGLGIPAKKKDYNNYKIKFSSMGHTPVMVPVFAYGTHAELLSGVYENTAIFTKMMKAFGFEEL